MRCEKYMIRTVLVLACLISEIASEPRWGWGRKRRSCRKTNCVPGPWSAWSSCSSTCGPHGTQYTRRQIKIPAKCGGTCLVTTHGARACNRVCLNGGTLIRTSCHCKRGYSGVCCQRVSGGWTSWGDWCACSKTCGRGSQYRKRTCTKPGGAGCPGSSKEYRSCEVKKCNTDGGWSRWSSWGHCTGSCGTGLQTRKRSCTNPPPGYGGKKCSGAAEQHKNCLLQRCPVNGGWSNWGAWGTCSKTCGSGTQYSRRRCNNPPPGYGGKMCAGASTRTRACSIRSCKTDGGWSSWSSWGHCTGSCGTGLQTRKRSCTNPPPGYGGKKCSGAAEQHKNCLLQRCPVNGGWSSWGKWCACSKTCGTGSQYRTRLCTRPPPSYGGKQCTGDNRQTRECHRHYCPVHGGWSNWGNWGTCTKTCGDGKQYSRRYCNNPVPKYGGKKCYGANSRTRACNVRPCPVNGRWAPWTAWSTCTKTCGTGSQTRRRTCTNPPPKYGGVCIGPSVQTKSCIKQKCPINGGWGSWGRWGACSKTCGAGTQYRSRDCNNPRPANGGKTCSGLNRESRKCNTKLCPVDGRWSQWTAWSSCSKTCGTGTKTRKRGCTNPPPQHGGKQCKGISDQTNSCLLKQCPAYGSWGSWGQWSACSKTCGTGTQNRKRKCEGYGGNCAGSNEETRHCNTQKCPVNGRWSQWGKWSACSKTCGTGTKTRKRGCTNPPPQHGGKQCKGISEQTNSCLLKQCPAYGSWGSWGQWSACSKTCGTGAQNRKRKCESYGGNCAGSNEETRHCNTQNCPVDGGWGDWSDWSACSVSCGPGNSIRSRQCNNPPPSSSGKQCTGLPVESKPCNAGLCPVDGGWGDWDDWSACSVSCGPGNSIRSRQCNNPPPSSGGKQCTGLPVESKPCNDGSCPIDGGWGDWSDWSACSVSCGPGNSIRSRQCNNPPPSSGGKQCTGLPVESKPCNDGSCPVDGGWGDWSDWSACSVSCGPGNSIRSRQCNNPPPGPGGKQCSGFPVASRPCNEGDCPGSEECWGDWSDWSPCDKACGCGKTYRVRFCKCAHGQGHDQCQGLGESSQSCNCHSCPNGPPSDDVVEG